MPEMPEQPTVTPTRNDDFREFLKTEYTNIAPAHFAAGTTITNFFQFYVLIIGLPITVAGVVQKIGGTSTSSVGIVQLLADPLVPILALTVGILGMFLMWHIVTLRFDAIRYARTINGVRKRFYNNAGLGTREELAMRGLPRTITKPHYVEKHTFGGIICSFATLNSSYLALAVWNLIHNQYELVRNIGAFMGASAPPTSIPLLSGVFQWLTGVLRSLLAWSLHPGGAETLSTLSFFVFFLLHWALYVVLARYQSHRSWKRLRIGIDIDGVLGDHRQQFAKILATGNESKTLDPESITRIPLHECNTLTNAAGEHLTLVQRDEHAVFNNSNYWKDMPAYQDAAPVLQELHDAYRFRIMIFTYRPWPNPASYPDSMTTGGWTTGPLITRLATIAPRKTKGRLVRCWNWLLERSRRTAMTRITTAWLRENNVPFDSLVVERGNTHVADARSHGHNRFRYSEREDIRIFVDDDLAKARKRADICELVYLIDQPYNQADDLPNNMVRVKNWTAIKQHIRDNL